MKSFQAPAIRICGAATLVVVLISLLEIGQLVLGMQTLPGLALPLGLAVLVSFAAFLVANAPRLEVAQGICLSSVVVIGVLLPLYLYRTGVEGIGFLDVALALFDCALLAGLCRGVLARRAAAA